MKAQVNSVNSPAEYLRRGVDNPAGVGKVHKKTKKEAKESQEIKEYLTKLQELVPFTPKNKKLSKLEVISYVIDYIQDLRETLGLPPSPCQNGNDPLDEQFTWMLMDSQSLSPSASVDDELTNEDLQAYSPVTPSTVAAATITVTSSPQHFQPSRQPLCLISNPGGNTEPTRSLLTSSSSVKSSLVFNSATTTSSNCDH